MSEPLFDKVAGLEPGNLLKKDSSTGVFCGFCKKFMKSFFPESLWVTISRKLRNLG